MELRECIAAVVDAWQAQPQSDDEAIAATLQKQGIDEALATKLLQFVPIAFTRYVMRGSGIRFAPNYVLMDRRGQKVGEHPLDGEPVFQETLAYCEAARAEGRPPAFFLSVAARSGGYKAIQQLIAQGSNPEGIITSPPILQAPEPAPALSRWRWPFRK